MAKKIIPLKKQQYKLVITHQFRDNLDYIAEYGANIFGELVSRKFVQQVIQKVGMLL
jgi:hypothetical protein